MVVSLLRLSLIVAVGSVDDGSVVVSLSRLGLFVAVAVGSVAVAVFACWAGSVAVSEVACGAMAMAFTGTE